MTRPRVLLTRPLPPGPMERLQRRTDLDAHDEDEALPREALLERVRDRDGLLCLLTDRIDAEVFDAAPGLKAVANYAVGYENIDVAEATRRGIPVAYTPGVLTEATADMAFALLLATARRVAEGDRLVRSGGWRGWGPLQLLGGEVTGATLGLVGLGRIGRAMIPRAQGFAMDVAYWNRTRLPPDEEAALGVRYLPFDDLLTAATFVSVHVAATPDTRHLIDERALARIGPEGYLVNTARGPIVDEAALVQALRRGDIAGAGLDVYEAEPRLAPGLADLPNAVLAPHLGSATHATRTAMGDLAVDGLLGVLRGERPRNVVNPEAFERRGGA